MNDVAVMPVLELRSLSRHFRQAEREIHVLRGVNLTLRRGEMTALVGPSGAGKTTMLQIAGLLDHPDDGELLIQGKSAARLSDNERTAIRNREIGFVYQFHHLLREFTARENIMLPQLIAGVSKAEAGARADDLLKRLGLSERGSHRPSRLSGGEQQRVAIARAVANRPALLLADEPTGNLDHATGGNVFAYLREIVRSEGIAALVATHNLELAAQMDRILRLEEGHLVEKNHSQTDHGGPIDAAELQAEIDTMLAHLDEAQDIEAGRRERIRETLLNLQALLLEKETVEPHHVEPHLHELEAALASVENAVLLKLLRPNFIRSLTAQLGG